MTLGGAKVQGLVPKIWRLMYQQVIFMIPSPIKIELPSQILPSLFPDGPLFLKPSISYLLCWHPMVTHNVVLAAMVLKNSLR